MAGAKITQYTNELLVFSNDDLLDVSAKISSGPDIFESKKVKWSTVLAAVGANKLTQGGDNFGADVVYGSTNVNYGAKIKAGNAIVATFSNTGELGINSVTNADYKVLIKSFGSSGLQYGLVVQDGSGAELLSVRDDKRVIIGNGSFFSASPARLEVTNVAGSATNTLAVTAYNGSAIVAKSSNGFAMTLESISADAMDVKAAGRCAVFTNTTATNYNISLICNGAGGGAFINQAGTVGVGNTTIPLYVLRSSTLGANNLTGAVVKIEDSTAATGNLLHVIKQSADKFIIDKDGNVVIGASSAVGNKLYVRAATDFNLTYNKNTLLNYNQIGSVDDSSSVYQPLRILAKDIWHYSDDEGNRVSRDQTFCSDATDVYNDKHQCSEVTTNATQTRLKFHTIATGEIHSFTATVHAWCTGGSAGTVGHVGIYKIEFAAKNVGGTITAATLLVSSIHEDVAAWDVDAVATTVSGGWEIRVTGAADTNITWVLNHCELNITKV